MESFYSTEELKKLGLKKIGTNARISRKASIYNAEEIEIGNNVRIDDFCILSGRIVLGDYIHISAYTSLFAGDAGIVLEDFVTISSRTAVYAITDDYSGNYMPNPLIPNKYRNVQAQKVKFHKHTLIGTGCTVLPGVEVGEGASVGAMSLLNRNVEPWTINVGIPVKAIKKRSKNILELEKQFLEEIAMETKQE